MGHFSEHPCQRQDNSSVGRAAPLTGGDATAAVAAAAVAVTEDVVIAET